jgi:hypothetical protein
MFFNTLIFLSNSLQLFNWFMSINESIGVITYTDNIIDICMQ